MGESCALRVRCASRIVHVQPSWVSYHARHIARSPGTLSNSWDELSVCTQLCVSDQGQRSLNVRMPGTLALRMMFASLWCAGLHCQEPWSSALPPSVKVMLSLSRCPSDHPTKNLGCLWSVALLRIGTRSKNPIAWCFCRQGVLHGRGHVGRTATAQINVG